MSTSPSRPFALSSQKLQLARLLLKREDSTVTGIPRVPRSSGVTDFPLSFAQQRLWFLDQLEPGGFRYNIPDALRLSGPLNKEALEASFAEIIRRHEILRTTFVYCDDRPVQRVHPAQEFYLPTLDLRYCGDPEQQLHSILAEEAQRPFDLNRGPLLRTLLIQLQEEEHILFISLHHIIFDGWSTSVLHHELVSLYNAFNIGAASPLNELPIQYVDYAIWQRGWLQGDRLEQQRTYWQRQLAGIPSTLDLPTDYPRPAKAPPAAASLDIVLPPTLVERLNQLRLTEDATMFMILLTAFSILLSRYSQQTDILIGTPVANRLRAATEPLIGFFINTLVLRTDLSGNPTFRELLRRVREMALEAYTHQDIPFEQVVEIVQPVRDPGRTPLFQVMFALQNTAPLSPAVQLTDLAVQSVSTGSETTKFDLTLMLEEHQQSIQGSLKYRCDLFSSATIASMVEHYYTLLEQVVADPEQCLSDLSLLTSPEQQRILVDWNATEATYPHDSCLHELFEVQAERTPEAVALICNEQQLTYGELNTRANQLANGLLCSGVGPETLVGLCMERSIEMVVGILGILKAGGVYLPFDPTTPRERLALLLAETQAPILLTQQHLANTFSGYPGQLYCLDSAWEMFAQESDLAPRSKVSPENLAYMIYTSGSTGKPKGVMIPHRAICNHLHWRQQTYPLLPSDRFLQKASISFDISVWETLWPLMAGATLVLAQPGGHKDSSYLVQALARQRITVVHFGPAMLRMVLEQAEFEANHHLKLVFCGGEALTLDLLELFFERHSASISQQYGPTEACVDSTIWDCVHDSAQQRVPIGGPIANTRIYLLDASFQPVPPGVTGEIYIGGVCLARGYYQHPELTAEKFVPDPFGALPGERLYKTGDFARFLPDGALEFLGRMDSQVKIRGYRIELGEVEVTLERHPEILQAVVVKREDIPGNAGLVAYLLMRGHEKPSNQQLRSYVQEHLPDYMIPSAFVWLDAFPLTTSGKIDRQSLPTPDQTQRGTSQFYVAPRDSVELRLVHIWEELLQVCSIGVMDDFFELGGHSLLAIRLIAHIQDVFQQNLPVATLFQGATIEHLANLLRQRQQNVDTPLSPLIALQPAGEGQPFFCVHPVGGDIFCYLDLARELGTDQPFYALQTVSLVDEQQPYQSIEEIAAQYICALRTRQQQGPYRLGGWSMGGVVAFEMACQLHDQGQDVAFLALIDAYPPSFILSDSHSTPQEASVSFIEDMAALFGIENTFLPAHSTKITVDEQLEYLLQEICRVHLLPQSTSIAYLKQRLQVFQMNRQALYAYIPRQYPNGLHLLRSREQMKENAEDTTVGWGALARGGVNVHILPGNHYTLVKKPHVSVLAEYLRTYLA